jgi:hypothetical protein
MNLTLDDLMTANNNGSLESLLLGYGLLPLEVLKFALDEVQPRIDKLEVDLDIARESLESYFE